MNTVETLSPEIGEAPSEIIERELDLEMQQKLDELKEHHLESGLHAEFMGKLCYDLVNNSGIDLGLSEEEKKQFTQAGFMHDIGKLKINPEILSGKKDISKEEMMEYVRDHVQESFKILKDDLGREDLAIICVAHHEFQLSKYPRKENAEVSQERRGKISKDKRKLQLLLSIVDKIEAMTSIREYRKDRAYDGRIPSEAIRREVINIASSDAEEASITGDQLAEIVDYLINSREILKTLNQDQD